jgi:hypothetical protein
MGLMMDSRKSLTCLQSMQETGRSIDMSLLCPSLLYVLYLRASCPSIRQPRDFPGDV